MTNFPELTPEENQTINKARSLGFAEYFPAYPDAKNQAMKTLKAAERYIHQENEAEAGVSSLVGKTPA